ncbi:MAG TPA: hypothetical protein VFS43_15250 [Polyangiaceae bacterium]|nr:hypothetical protein [Polyangiaceae bacterium]
MAQGPGGVPQRGRTSSTHLVNSAGGNTLTLASMFEWSLPQYSVQKTWSSPGSGASNHTVVYRPGMTSYFTR